MKRNTGKQIRQRVLALVLAFGLAFQSAPFAAITVSAEENTSAAVEEIRQSDVLNVPSEQDLEQETTSETEAVVPTEEPLSEEETADAEQEPAKAESEAVNTEQQTAEEPVQAEEPQSEPADPDESLAAAEIGTVQVTSAKQLTNGVPQGSTYVLANDIVMENGQQIDAVAGVLDGAGHTITLSGRPLVRELTGTIQNLMVNGKASLQDGEGSIVCTVKGGILQNCASMVQIDPGWAFSVGGMVGRSENAKIYNSYFAGAGRDTFGLVVNTGIFHTSDNAAAPSQIKNCYYTEGNGLGAGSAWNREDGSNGQRSADQMKTPEFVKLLNASNVGSGYIWEAQQGAFPKLVPGGGEVEVCDKTELQAVIKEAESKNESDYTGESWAAMQQALKEAKTIYEKVDALQEEADNAAKDLRNAIANLAEKVRELAPVEPPKNGVIFISSQQELAQIDGSNEKAFYQLTQDIVIKDNFVSPNLAGVFDGGGHTITICTASPAFNVIAETGVVQNLYVKAEGNFTNRYEFAPVAEKLKGGMIVNCISEVTGQHSAGYVRKMDGGVMVNCLTMGHNRRGAFVFFQKSTDHQNSNGYQSGKFYNCYWSASNSVENITPTENLTGCEPVGDERLRSDEFIAQLNGQKGEFGVSWGRDASGYPYFGKDQGDCVIDGSSNRYPVQFVWHDDKVLDIQNGNLQLSPQMTGSNRFAGTFRLQNVPKDSTITWSCEDRTDQQIMQMNKQGELYVFYDGGGVVRAMEHKADGTEELAAEIRVVSASREIKELRLLLDGNVIENAATVQGSATKYLEVQAKYAGSEQFEKLPSYLVEVTSEKPELLRTDYNTAAFYFKEPGTSKLTVTEKTQKDDPVSVTVSITSEYVPVKSVKPAISGVVPIHYRNSMGSGQFISFSQTVFVEPANASYKDLVTVQSSDPSVAQYDGSGYTPYKNGTVTFTAKLNDKGNVVEGESTVQFVYSNPLSKVEAAEQTITINQNEKVQLPLEFFGQPGNRHQITEPNLIWSFDKKGIVSIQRPNALMQVRNTGGPDDGNWVASTVFEARGLRPGTVLVTGTPVDTTGGAKPVQFTITVKGDGSEVQSFDIPKFIKTGKEAAINYLNKNNTFEFGEEWTIFALLRDGQTLPQAQLQSYYEDVANNVSSWNVNVLATDVERTAIALNVMGKDITDVNGVNLAELICNHPNLTKQGSNALAWALLALDMNNTPIPANAVWTRERMIEELLTYQNPDGGFGLDKMGMSGIDMTAMSLQALARYQKQDQVAAAIEKGMEYLAAAAEINLNLGSSESISQVIITLAVLNRDIVEEPGFGDEVENLFSALEEYMVEGEGFKHSKNGEVDKMATAQAMQALCAYERFLNGESGYWDLKGNGLAEGPAEQVIGMIENLPQKLTLADAYKVKQAREAYEKLTEKQKAQVTNLAKLEAAEAALKELVSVEGVVQMINDLPQKITLANEETVQTVRSAYDLLTEVQKKQVTNVDKLLQAEKAIADQKAAAAVEKQIEAIPVPLGISDREMVKAARKAYEELTADQKALVNNLDKLIRAEEELKDLDAAQAVMDLIKELPAEIEISDEEAVKTARKAYEALNEKQQKLVLNLYLLERSEQQLADKKAVKAVEDAIDALPENVTEANWQAVKDARAAYNKLSPELRKQVKNLDKLKNAEKALHRFLNASTGEYRTVSNVVEAVVENGIVSAKQLEKVKGKDLILRVKGTMESGEAYELSLYGKDIEKVQDLKVGMNRKGLYEDEIHILSEDAEIFRFAETGEFPGPMMVQMPSGLEDGEYLLLKYDPKQQKAALVSRVNVAEGMVKFIVQEGGEYFLAKKASKKSVSELNEENQRLEESEPENAEKEAADSEIAPQQQETVDVQPYTDSSILNWIWLPILVLAVVAAILVFKKRKEKKGE